MNMMIIIKYLLIGFIIIFAVASPTVAASLNSAQIAYVGKDYKTAASEYGFLLTLNWPKENLGDLYDRYTECLFIIGNYDLAEAKIEYFLSIQPDSLVSPKLKARSAEIEKMRLGADRVVNVDLSSAREFLAKDNYQQAVVAYQALLECAKPENIPEIYDGLTRSLVVTGQYDSAYKLIDKYVASYPNDVLCAYFIMQKIIITYENDNITSATVLAASFLLNHDVLNADNFIVTKIYSDCLHKLGKHDEQMEFIDEILLKYPKHSYYSELRMAQGDYLSNAPKQASQACAKYIDAMDHVTSTSEIYENCAFRIGEIKYEQYRSDGVTSKGLAMESEKYLNIFLNHPGALDIYPSNAVRRLVALKHLKLYDQMENEAISYLDNNNNYIIYSEYVAVKNIIGEYIDISQSSRDIDAYQKAAIQQIKNAFYGENYLSAIKLSKEYLSANDANNCASHQVEQFLIGSFNKIHSRQELIDYIDNNLSTNPNHPMYAKYRRAQADMYWEMKKSSDARAKYSDVLLHVSKDDDLYDWCCYRIGASFMTEASAQPKGNAQQIISLKTEGRKYLAEYVNLPSKDRIYPANIKRRMMAFNWLGQNDKMELEAGRYLADRGDYKKDVYLDIMRLLSYNRSIRNTPDEKGAFAAFEQLRLNEYQFKNANSKLYTGITMLKSADRLGKQGARKSDVAALLATGRKFLTEAIKDNNLNTKNKIEAYYYLGDWIALKNIAHNNLETTDINDSGTRAEMMNWMGIALINEAPKNVDNALEWFNATLQEYEKSPDMVKDKAVLAVFWCISIKLANKDNSGARAYLMKLSNMPECDLKNKILQDYRFLNESR